MLCGCAGAATPLLDSGNLRNAQSDANTQVSTNLRSFPPMRSDISGQYSGLLQDIREPQGLKRGLYTRNTSGNVDGFPTRNKANGAPFCVLQGVSSDYSNVEFDAKGRMIVPNYTNKTISAPRLHQRGQGPAGSCSA